MVARVCPTLVLAAACYAALAAASTGQGSPQIATDTTATGIDSGSGSSGVDGMATVSQPRRPIDELSAISGIPLWVDPTTPDDKQTYVSSRGETWELVMSDEFGDPARNFTPGRDHLWTSLEKPDGVNGALEFYAHNMSYITCEPSKSDTDTTSTNTTAVCYLTMEVQDVVSRIEVYNMYSRPPSMQIAKFYYRAAMMQTWNKFCFQGGMVEVRAQLPGAVSKESKNPDVAGGPNARTKTGAFYPTWPGIWMMGNLGRAIFSGSTSRMWPFSYNECNPDAFDPKNQRISACESNPGHGLNPNQGRGAPEIDLLEGGGVAISSSIQIGPGLKVKYRRIPVNLTIPNEYKDCVYNGACQTPGANLPNVPTALYKPRKYQTWYKGLRYSSNSFCAMDPKEKQTYAQISAAIVNITKDTCSVETCPASRDVQADLSFIPNDKTKARWGINSKGTCAAIMNNYMGSFLCDPDSTNPMCETPRNATTPKTNVMEPFAYQMDALSANWGVHVGAYTDFLTYQVEWVMGDTGYLRWMLYGNPIFEIPAESVVKGPQAKTDPNPQLTFPEEPMYLIFNVALSNQWGAMPPNAGKGPCGMMVGKPEIDNQTKLVCDSFPMYMKIDYIRVYQDKSPNSTMAVGCDPKTHPTRQWIFDHIKEYEDDQNPFVEVDGGAYCRNDLDCMIPFNTTVNFATGNCVEWRCKCNTKYWGGPRCTTALKITDLSTAAKQAPSYGPPLYLSITIGSISIVMTCVIIAFCTRRRRRKDVELQQKLAKMKTELTIEKASLLPSSDFDEIELARHSNATPQSRYQPLSAKGA